MQKINNQLVLRKDDYELLISYLKAGTVKRPLTAEMQKTCKQN